VNIQPHRDEEAVTESGAVEVPPQVNQSSDLSPEVSSVLGHALSRTLEMLQQHNLASAEDCSQVANKVQSRWQLGQGADPVMSLARLRAGGGDMLDTSVEMISSKLGGSLPFAEDLDVIGIASINSYFADAIITHIKENIKNETGVQPIMHNIRLDYLGWAKMCKKHFRQDV
jgi:hypothetical protein